MTSKRRFPSESESAGAVILVWPDRQTDWAPYLTEARECYAEMCRVVNSEVSTILVTRSPGSTRGWRRLLAPFVTREVHIPYNDTWVRDYGPISVEDDGNPALIDFGFNGWGLKFAADRDNLAVSALTRAGLFAVKPENRRGFILEGGSLESDGHGTLMTTESCLLSPNRNPGLSKSAIERRLKNLLGVERILWAGDTILPGDDTDGHIDTLARFADERTILHVRNPQLEERLRSFQTAAGEPCRLIPLPTPEALRDPSDGSLLPATYANFLDTPEAVIVPTYGCPAADAEALEVIAAAFPGKRVKGVDCRVLVRQHGSLHCSTMQIPASVLNL